MQRILAGVNDPLAIEIPEQLWILLGISTTSLVGSPLIRSTKTQKTPAGEVTDEEIRKYAEEKEKEYKQKGEDINATDSSYNIDLANYTKFVENDAIINGLNDSNPDVKNASFSDLFKGDEKGNKRYVDMAKVQMFFFTLIIAFTYMVMLFNLIRTTAPAEISRFPELSDSMVALLGISSAGYLANKTYDHTKKK